VTITYYVSKHVLIESISPTDPEFIRVCALFGYDPLSIVTIHVTIIREPLDEEKLHAKIARTRRELASSTDTEDELPF